VLDSRKTAETEDAADESGDIDIGTETHGK
jgi:hypothetical protein